MHDPSQFGEVAAGQSQIAQSIFPVGVKATETSTQSGETRSMVSRATWSIGFVPHHRGCRRQRYVDRQTWCLWSPISAAFPVPGDGTDGGDVEHIRIIPKDRLVSVPMVDVPVHDQHLLAPCRQRSCGDRDIC